MFLARPTQASAIELPPSVTLTHDAENDTDSFSGYEFYYKFYDPSDYLTAFSSDRTAVENALPSQVIATLASQGFYRAFAEDGTNARPAVSITSDERDIAFEFTLTFAPTSASTTDPAMVEWDATGPQSAILQRDQTQLGDPEPPLGFLPADLTPTDSSENLDMPAGITTTDPLRMAIAILAYGIDFTTGTFATVYSQATVVDRALQINTQ